ncbi:MAG: T9SS type A sorting domain-containing protein [Bacteroidota bacterium]
MNQNQSIGYYTVEFNAKDLPSGLYIYKLESGNFSSIKKMILMK